MSKLIGPKIHPSQYRKGFGPKDFHLIVNDEAETVKAYDHSGRQLWILPALAKGVAGPDWRQRGADTPPGLYLLDACYADYESVNAGLHVDEETLMAYGWYTFDMYDCEGQESAVGRAGICLHGGGSAHWRNGAYWDELQPYLAKTHGCVRMHNIHLRDYVLPLYRGGGLVYVSVYQDA